MFFNNSEHDWIKNVFYRIYSFLKSKDENFFGFETFDIQFTNLSYLASGFLNFEMALSHYEIRDDLGGGIGLYIADDYLKEVRRKESGEENISEYHKSISLNENRRLRGEDLRFLEMMFDRVCEQNGSIAVHAEALRKLEAYHIHRGNRREKEGELLKAMNELQDCLGSIWAKQGKIVNVAGAFETIFDLMKEAPNRELCKSFFDDGNTREMGKKAKEWKNSFPEIKWGMEGNDLNHFTMADLVVEVSRYDTSFSNFLEEKFLEAMKSGEFEKAEKIVDSGRKFLEASKERESLLKEAREVGIVALSYKTQATSLK